MAAKALIEATLSLQSEQLAHEADMARQVHAVRYPVGRAGHEILADERDLDTALAELQVGMDLILQHRVVLAQTSREYVTIGHVHNVLLRLRGRCENERRSLTRADATLQAIVRHHDCYRERLIRRNEAILAGASLENAEEVA
jgi:hypothetical protein